MKGWIWLLMIFMQLVVIIIGFLWFCRYCCMQGMCGFLVGCSRFQCLVDSLLWCSLVRLVVFYILLVMLKFCCSSFVVVFILCRIELLFISCMCGCKVLLVVVGCSRQRFFRMLVLVFLGSVGCGQFLLSMVMQQQLFFWLIYMWCRLLWMIIVSLQLQVGLQDMQFGIIDDSMWLWLLLC